MTNHNTSPHFRRVRTFMQKASQSTPIRATFPDDKTRLLRARLLLEEVMETVEALGVTMRVAVTDPAGHVKYDGLRLEALDLSAETQEQKDARFLEIVDGLADVAVVNLGSFAAIGVPDIPAMDEVCDSNDSKFAPGHSFREDGKLLKSPLYKPADFSKAVQQDVLA
jgi:predicted HAD superfamily Cof-like phosphohydrolase